MPDILTDEDIERESGLLTDEEIEKEEAIERYSRSAAGAIQSGVRGAARGIGEIGSFLDRWTGPASTRAAVHAAQHGKRMDEAFFNQFLKPAETAPSGKDIAAQAGLSTAETIPTPFRTITGGNVKASPAGLAGSVAEAALDPMTYFPPVGAEKAAAGLLRNAPHVVDVAAGAARGVGKKAANVVAGIDEGTFNYYMKNADRINKSKGRTIEDIKDVIDTDVASVLKDTDAVAARRKTLEEQLTGKVAAKKKELEGSTTSLAEARQVMADLNSEKAVLGTLSEQADEALARSGATFERQHMLDLIDDVGKSFGPHIIGNETNAAVESLMRTRDRVAGLPDQILAPQLRSILRQIRKDIDFDLRAGEFNSELNAARKRIAGSLSTALKDVSPEYASYMQRMAVLSENLEGMSRHFGDEGKAIASMETVRKGKTPGGQVIEDVLSRYAAATGRKDLTDKMARFRENREALAKMSQDPEFGKSQFPKEMGELAEAGAEEQMARGVSEPVERLTPARTQGIIRQQGGMAPSIEDRRALEALGRTSGADYGEMIKDRNVLDKFKRDQTRGSRLTNLGAATGAATGAAVGGPQGAGVGTVLGGWSGASADKYAAQVTKALMDKGITTKAALDLLASKIAQGGGEYAKYRKILEKSAAEGTRSLVVTHHLLMNNDPSYRKAFEEGP